MQGRKITESISTPSTGDWIKAADSIIPVLMDDPFTGAVDKRMIDFGVWLTGHDKATVEQMLNDYKKGSHDER